MPGVSRGQALAWDKRFEIGLPEIDAHQRLLVEHVNRLVSVHSEGAGDAAAGEQVMQSLHALYGALSERNAALTASGAALRKANEGLESRVAERTAELRQLASFLEKANEQLRQNFMSAVRVLSNTIELAGREENRHARRVAELGRDLALGLALPPSHVQTITVGGLLHDLGRIGLDPRLLEKPWAALKADEKSALERHPLRAHTALVGSPGFDEAALAIRHCHERWDGTGFPDGLAGREIPACARVLAVAEDFEHLRLGYLTGRAMAAMAAADHIRERAGKTYDPSVVVQLMKHLAEKDGVYPEVVCEAALEELEPGMVLGRDVVTGTGVPILARDQALTTIHIRRLKDLAGDLPEFFVRRSGPEALAIVLEALEAIPAAQPPPAKRARPPAFAATRS